MYNSAIKTEDGQLLSPCFEMIILKEEKMRKDTQFIAQKIRSQYVEREVTELDELRRLDKTVKLPANIFGYTFGTAGALALGTGMSLAMGVIGSSMALGIVIGVVGIAMVSVNYMLYSKLLAKRRAKHQDAVLKITNRIIGE